MAHGRRWVRARFLHGTAPRRLRAAASTPSQVQCTRCEATIVGQREHTLTCTALRTLERKQTWPSMTWRGREGEGSEGTGSEATTDKW